MILKLGDLHLQCSQKRVKTIVTLWILSRLPKTYFAQHNQVAITLS